MKRFCPGCGLEMVGYTVEDTAGNMELRRYVCAYLGYQCPLAEFQIWEEKE